MIFRNQRRGYSPGTVTVKRLGRARLVSHRRGGEGVDVQHDQYIWKAPRSARAPCRAIAASFSTSTRRTTTSAASCPGRKMDSQAMWCCAFQYGHSLLARDQNFDWDRWCEYLVAKHAFDRLEHVQERIRCMFRSTQTLTIRTALHSAIGRANVLPDEFGQSASGAGIRWSVARLLEEGQQAACLAGVTKPSGQDLIAYGLAEAAKLNPIQVTEAEAAALVRMSLYDFSRSGSRVTDAHRETVWQRFHDWIREHLYDEREQFKKCFFGGHNNLINSIAHRAATRGGKLTRPVVKRALHDLGWRGYELVGECLEAFAQAFSSGLLSKPLSSQEQAYFEVMYCRQSYLGGSPLVLVMERRALIKPMILELWENPGDELLIGALHRLLHCYAEMVSVRREADRLAKQKPANVLVCEHAPQRRNWYRHRN